MQVLILQHRPSNEEGDIHPEGSRIASELQVAAADYCSPASAVSLANGTLGSALVKKSAILSEVATYLGSIAPFSTSFLTLWYLTAMCLVLGEMGIPFCWIY
jgi:hypothetical protein